MTLIDRCLSGVRRGLLCLVLVVICPIADSIAQSMPILGYAAAENAKAFSMRTIVV